MTKFLPVIIVGFFSALMLTPLSRQIAMRLGVVDRPSGRKVHSTPMPLMGGLAIYLAILVALLIFGPPAYLTELGGVLAGASLLALVGLWDDSHSLKPLAKLVAQLMAGAVLIVTGIQVHLFGIALPDIALTLLWVAGITNAINFLDNMDGLAAGVSAIAALSFFVLAASEGLGLVASLAAAIAGSSIGFLIYNFNPASSFMGDMGSLVLGFTLAVLGIKLEFPARYSFVTWMIPVLVLGLPIFDTTLVVFTRIREGRPITQAGKDHTSHRLMALGLDQRATAILLYGVCAALGAAAWAVSKSTAGVAFVIGGVTALLAAIAFAALEFIRIKGTSRG